MDEVRDKLELIIKTAQEVLALRDNVIRSSDNLFSIIDSSKPDSTLILDAEGRWDGDYIFTKPITLQSSLLPRARIPANHPTPIINGQLVCEASVKFTGIGLTTIGQYDTALVFGDDTVFDRGKITGNMKRGITANSSHCSILRSFIQTWNDDESKAVGAWDKTNDLEINDCYLEGSGMSFLIGGGYTESNPNNIRFINCDFAKNINRKGEKNYKAKNLFEIKNGSNILIQNCRGEYSWPDAQIGFAFSLTVRNQNGNAPNSNITNVVIDGLKIKHCEHGIQVLGRDDQYPSGIMDNVMMKNISFEDINNGNQIYISYGPKNLSFENIHFTGSNLNSAIYLDGPKVSNQVLYKLEKLSMKNVEMAEGRYGIFGNDDTPGMKSLEDYVNSYEFENVIFNRTIPSNDMKYPSGIIVN